MCGIAGSLVFDSSGFRVTEAYLGSMCDAMAHRGPDGSGLWVHGGGHLGFGHRRLSIIDLSPAASQPMSDEARGLWVTFNGEIYNHAELRSELELLEERPWKTDHSDTEVILRAYGQWGIDCVHRFRGMFAFALWDDRSRELWLVRDRIGIKPLYYSIHHGRLVFASEIKALLRDPDQPRAVNEEGLFHYLTFLTAPAPMTLFEGIWKMPAGTRMRVRADGETQIQRYWDVLDHAAPLAASSDEEVAAMVLGELRTAVRLRKVSDVPMGVFLSGGIDSSTNAALFAEGESSAIRTFSIGYGDDYPSNPSEFPFARRAAGHVGAEHHERVLVLKDLLDFLPEMIRLQDEPIGDPVCVPLYYVAKLARDSGVTVCQVGEGADELFWGYPSWKRCLRMQRLQGLPLARPLSRALVMGLDLAGKGRSDYAKWARRAASGEVLFWSGAEAFFGSHKERILSPRLRKKFAGRTSWDLLRPLYDRFREKAWEPSNLNWMTYVDLNVRLPELLLMRVDKMTMGASLEARVPFLDHKLVELAMSIPETMKTGGGNLKHVLKVGVRGLIPDEIIDRPKQGFGVPVNEWILSGLGSHARASLEDFLRSTDYFDRDAVDGLFREGNGDQIWYALNFALWWKDAFYA
jgi:asparagine synthase (glutamine-hydrolysing)